MEATVSAPGIVRVESLGSVWEIDENLNRYRRFPKTETGREKPEWSDERAGALQDAVWHDFTGDWEIRKRPIVVEWDWVEDRPVMGAQSILVIHLDGDHVAVAPDAWRRP